MINPDIFLTAEIAKTAKGAKQAESTTQAVLAKIAPDLDRALSLAWAARAAAAAGNHAQAESLRAEHDSIFERIEKCLP